MDYQQEVTADSPIHWWRFAELSSPWIDSVGGIQLISTNGGTTARTTSPVQTYALRIITDWNIKTSGFFPTLGDTFTLEYWLKPTDVLTAGGFFAEIGTANGGGIYAVAEGNVLSIGLATGSDFRAIEFPVPVISPSQWTHIVYTIDGGDGRLYINGQLLLGPEDHSAGVVSPWSSDFGLMLYGEFGVTTGEAEYAEVAIYDYALSASRVAAHYGTTAFEPPPDDIGSNYKTLILSDGPTVYYRFNDLETSSRTWDSSGNQNHGSYHGDVEKQQTEIIVQDFSKSVYFPGGPPNNQGPYVDIPVSPIQSLTAVSVECWFVWDSDEPNQRIFDFNNGVVGSTEGKYFFCSVYHHLSGLCRAAVSLNGLDSDVIVDSIPIIPSRKYHVVCTLGNGKLAIFINGQKIQEADTTLTLQQLGISQAWISRSPWSVDTYFRGKKDEFAIYPRILTDDEIQEHYTVGVSDAGPQPLEVFVDDNIVFNQTTSYFHQPAGSGGQIYSFTISDSLNFADGASGPPQPQSIKDILFFIDTTNYSQFPTRMLFKEQIVFIDSAHGSPHRITIKDTLVFAEIARHNQHKPIVQDNLVFVDMPDPHWFEELVLDTLIFTETPWGQNNHQYWTDTLAFTESFGGRFSIKNFAIIDNLTFNEVANLRWSIANLTVTDTLTFVDELHRILEEDYTDVLVFEDVAVRSFPESLEDELQFDETIDYSSSQVFIDKLTLVEVFCVESTLSRSVLDTVTFRQYAAFLINGPEDPRNGGSSPGGSGGITLSGTYKKVLMDRLQFVETIVSDPAPDGKDCVVEVN